MTTYIRDTRNGDVFSTSTPQYYDGADYERLTVKSGKAALKQSALVRLHKILKPGDTVYSILRHVSSSGMSRCIDFFVFRDNEPVCLSGLIKDLGTYKRHATRQGLIVGGCGMDMGFHVVYQLGSRMWPDGTPAPHGTRNGEPDSDGGYALNHRWL
jgi:hypothetical protein